MAPQEPTLLLPGWWRHPSGLWLPGTDAEGALGADLEDVPEDVRPRRTPVILDRGDQGPKERLLVYADEDLIGLDETGPEDLAWMVRQVGREPALVVLARLAAQVYSMGSDAASHLQLAGEFYGDGPLLRRFEHLTRQKENVQLFAEQQIYVLMRLLTSYGADQTLDEPLTDRQHALLRRALLSCSTLVSRVTTAGANLSDSAEDWFAYIIQNSAYHARESPLPTVARAQELLRLAQDERAQEHPQFCPLDEWMRDQHGLGLDEQFTLGITLGSMSHAWDNWPAAGGRVYIAASNVDDALHKAGLLERRERALDVIAGTTEQMRHEFVAYGDSDRHLLWDLRAFKSRPFHRLQSGGLVLLSPRFIQSWLSEGFHYRSLSTAQEMEANDRVPKAVHPYTAFAGSLFERYCLELAQRSHHRPGLDGVRVHGEQLYRKRQELTSDISIDAGTDLVLIEVTSSRLRADTLAGGGNSEAMADLERVLVSKVRQLHNCIENLRTGKAAIPGVDLDNVVRIWPVAVSAGATMQNPIMWDYLDRQTGDLLKQPGVQPLTLLDPEEFEELCGQVEAGETIAGMLARKTSGPWARFDLAAWLVDDPHAPKRRVRARYLEEIFETAYQRAVRMIDFSRGVQPEAA